MPSQVRFSSQSLPQNPCLIRSWYVNARSMTEPSEMEVTNAEGLDAIFRAHYERIARVIGRVIHDQARAEELAVEVFLKWWRNPQAHGEQAAGWLYRTAVREALDELRRQTRRSRFERLFSSRVHRSLICRIGYPPGSCRITSRTVVGSSPQIDIHKSRGKPGGLDWCIQAESLIELQFFRILKMTPLNRSGAAGRGSSPPLVFAQASLCQPISDSGQKVQTGPSILRRLFDFINHQNVDLRLG